jgi:hypothetical protein
MIPAIALMVSMTTLSAAEPDLLFRDSFEEGQRTPDDWQQGNPVPGVKYVWDRRLASDGKRSLSLQKSANRYFPIAAWSRTVPHSGDKPVVQVSAQVKADRVTKAIIDVVFLDERSQAISHEWLSYIGQKEQTDPVADHDWQEYSGGAAIPPHTKKIVVSLQIYGPG